MVFDKQVQTLTQDYIVPKVTDEVYGSNFFTMAVMAQGRPFLGESLKMPVKMTTHTQSGSFTDFQRFNVNAENVREMATFDVRAFYANVTIGGIARSVNGTSKTKLLDLVKVEMESNQQDMMDKLGTISYSNGTGNGGADFLGLKAAIDDGTNVDTYGNISRASFTNWRSQIQTSVGAFDFTKARTLHNSASRGNQKPTLDTCDESVFGYIEADYQASVEGNYNLIEGNRQSMGKGGQILPTRAGLLGQAGFDLLYFAGTPIMKDDKATSGHLFSVNVPMYRWYGVKPAECSEVQIQNLYHDASNYDNAPSSYGVGWTGFVRPGDAYSWSGQFIILGNAVTPAPNLHSYSSGINS